MQQVLHPDHAQNLDEEGRKMYEELYVPLHFAADMRSGMFTMTAQEYMVCPATLIEFVRMYRNEKFIIDAQDHADPD